MEKPTIKASMYLTGLALNKMKELHMFEEAREMVARIKDAKREDILKIILEYVDIN